MSSENKKEDKSELENKERTEETEKELEMESKKYHFRQEGDEEELQEIYGGVDSDVIKKGDKGDKKIKEKLLDMLTTKHHGR
jgi:hypothetical protein